MSSLPTPPPANGMERAEVGTKWLAGVFATAIAVRLVYFLQFAGSPLFGDYRLDHLYYLEWARRIAAGDWLGSDIFAQGPLYPYLLGIGFSLFGEQLVSVLLLQMLLGSAACVLVALCAQRLFDRTTAILAGLVAAVYGPFVFYEGLIMKSWLSPCLTIVSLYAALRFGESRQKRWLWVGGFSIGLACLVRENHILLVLPWLWWIWQAGPANNRQMTPRLLGVGHFAAAVLLCIVPVTVRNGIVGSELVFVTAGGGEVFYMAHGPEATGYYNPPDFVLPLPEVEHDDFRKEAARRTGRPLSPAESSRFWFREGLKSIANDPLRSLRLTGRKTIILLNDFEVDDTESFTVSRTFVPLLGWLPTFGWVGGLGLIGICRSVRGSKSERLAVALLAAHAAGVLILYNFGRFRLGMMPLWIIFSAAAAVWIIRVIRGPNSPHRIKGIAAAVVAFLLSAGMFISIEPESYTLGQGLVIGKLAGNHGQYELAEAEYRKAIRLLESQRKQRGELPDSDYASLASAYAELADVCYQRGKVQETIAYFQRARAIPARSEIRETVLLHSLSLLHAILRETSDEGQRRRLRNENESAAEELSEIDPYSIRNRALLLYYASMPNRVRTEADQLENVWHQIDQPSAEERGWYHLGRAVTEAAGGNPAEAANQARLALRANPAHPFRPELELLIENGPK